MLLLKFSGGLINGAEVRKVQVLLILYKKLPVLEILVI